MLNFHLIYDKKLHKTNFKKTVIKLDWKYSVKLRAGKEDVFYIGLLSTEDKIIKIKIRPSLLMTVMETFKKCTMQGELAPEGYKGDLYEFGTSVEVKISEDFLNKLVKKVKPKKLDNSTKTLEW